MIDSASALADLCRRARSAPAVALDTEFVWERTYYPALGVVQIGLGGDDVHLVDTLALDRDDLQPLGDLIADPDCEIVLHDALQDLQILARATGAQPRNVFDTQRVAGFVGLTASASLQDLVEWATGRRLDKGETRTNWLRRPLSDKQIRYAEDDVRYMPDVRDKLLDEVEARGRMDWVDDEMLRYERAADYAEPDPMLAVTRVKAKNVGRLSGQQREVLRHVAAWREREARELDRTRRMVLPDDVLVKLAQLCPEDAAGLRRAGLTDRQLRRYENGLLDAIDDGMEAEPEPRVRRGRPTDDDERRQTQLLVLQALAAGRGAREGVDPAIVATKSDLRDLVAAGVAASAEDHAVLRGWRRDYIGADLAAFLRGELAVGLSGPDGWPEGVGD